MNWTNNSAVDTDNQLIAFLEAKLKAEKERNDKNEQRIKDLQDIVIELSEGGDNNG